MAHFTVGLSLQIISQHSHYLPYQWVVKGHFLRVKRDGNVQILQCTEHAFFYTSTEYPSNLV